MKTRDQHYYKILSAISLGQFVSQRTISRDLGIALGLTNLLIKRLVKKGYVKTSRAIRGRRLQYLLTRRGLIEQARLSRAFLENTINLYTETRERIKERLEDVTSGEGNPPCRRIVFYGAGEVAEIAFVCLDGCDCELVRVVDDHKQGETFFGHLIGPPSDLVSPDGSCEGWDKIFVATLRRAEEIRDRLGELEIPADRVAFLQAVQAGTRAAQGLQRR